METKLFDFSFVIDSLGCDVVGKKQGVVTDVVLDSRQAVDGTLFVPLVGEIQDGNKYITSALSSGCRISLVSRSYFDHNRVELEKLVNDTDSCLCIVDNTLKALQELAKKYKDQFKNLKVIAITGSSGKTTTKEVLGSIFTNYDETLVTQGNFNSETGLPLTVFRLRDKHKYAVLEIGMSKPGEIKALVDIIHPWVSVITNIGTAHIGFFESRDGIANEKKDAFANFIGDNIAVIPGWDDYTDFLSKDVNGHLVVADKSPEYITQVKDKGFEGWEFNYSGKIVKYPYIGKYNLLNAFIAIACSRKLGVPDDVIIKGLEGVKSLFGRGEVLKGKNKVIRDCYNANPGSTLASLELLQSTEWTGEKVAILGSMLELGEISYDEHVKIAGKAARYDFSKVILFGKEYEKVYAKFQESGNIYYSKDMKELKVFVKEAITDGSLVLLKASRGERLEDITEDIL